MSGGLLSCTTGRTLEIDTEFSPAIGKKIGFSFLNKWLRQQKIYRGVLLV